MMYQRRYLTLICGIALILASFLGTTNAYARHASAASNTKPLTARQWEMCAEVITPADGYLKPCTFQEVEVMLGVLDMYDEIDKWRQTWNAETTSHKPTLTSPPASVISQYHLKNSPPRSTRSSGSSRGSTGGSSQRSRAPNGSSGRSSRGRGGSRSPADPGAAGGGSSAATQPPGDSNPNNSLVNNDVLDLSNPACKVSGMTVEQESRCLRTGDPSVPYPLGNYQMDIHMDIGVTHPINNVFSVLESAMNVIWMLLLYVLKGGLTLMGWAFSLSPFTDSGTLTSVQNKLESMYGGLDNAWIDSAFICIGAYGAYLAFIRRRQSEAIGHLAASFLAIMLAVAIIHAPATFIGKPAGFVNGFAKDAISSANLAARNRTGTTPSSKLAGLTADLFDTFATGPFCALETNDVSWCLSPPSTVEMRAVKKAIHEDKNYESQAKAIAADVALRLPPKQQHSAYQTVYQALTSGATPPRRADLFLQYPVSSTPRDTLYALYSGENPDVGNPVGDVIKNVISRESSVFKDLTKADLLAVAGDVVTGDLKIAGSLLKLGVVAITSPVRDIGHLLGIGKKDDKPQPLAPNKIAIQGSSGIVQRSLVLILTIIALVGVLLVLLWIALHLVSQALLGFILLFATPVMMLTPAFGASGRRAFGTWGKTLMGAIASKAFYAAFLGVFVLALTALQAASTAALGPSVHLNPLSVAKTVVGVSGKSSPPSPTGGWGVPWVMQCLLCWAVFFKRNKIVGFFAIDPAMHQQSGSGSMGAMRVLGAAYAAHRLGGAVAGAAKRPINAYRANALEARMGREDAARDLAYGQLEQQELHTAQRNYDDNVEDQEYFREKLDHANQHISDLKQNPDYKKYVAWKKSQDMHDRLYGLHSKHQSPRFNGSIEEFDRGQAMAGQLARLEASRNAIRQRHSRAQKVVDHGDRNLQAHGQVLSPDEVQNRVEARRSALERDKGNPDAWKQDHNLELLEGHHVTPRYVENLEARAAHDSSARDELNSIRDEVQQRMAMSERLLAGVPVHGRFDRGGAASAPVEAIAALHEAGHGDRLRERARSRQHELKRERYRRKCRYRG